MHIHTCADPKVEIPPKIQDHVWRYDGRNTQGQLVHVTSPANNLAVVWRDLLISQEFRMLLVHYVFMIKRLSVYTHTHIKEIPPSVHALKAAVDYYPHSALIIFE